MMSAALAKRSMRVAGHRTSLALEPAFWAALERGAKARGVSIPALVAAIDDERRKHRPDASLASAVRVWLLRHTI